MRTVMWFAGIAAALLVAACGKDSDDTGGGAAKKTSATTPAPAVSAAPGASATTSPPEATATATATANAGPPAEIEMGTVKNLMQFDKTKLTVAAGQTVHLVLTNHANIDVLPHNWVLVRPGTEAKVAAAGLAKGVEAGYLAVPSDDVLAFAPMAGPGKTSEVTFTAPAAGTYPYICTVPGHYMMMKGVLTVTP